MEDKPTNRLLPMVLIRPSIIHDMSSYRLGESMPFRYDLEEAYVQYEIAPAPMERLMEEKFVALCRAEGVKRIELTPIQRLFLTHYKCPSCRLLPIYHLDLTHTRKARCAKCGNLVSFKSDGKYGRMRKKLAMMVWQARGGHHVS